MKYSVMIEVSHQGNKGDNVFSSIDSHGTIIEVSDWWPMGNANNGFIEKLIRYGIPTVRREIDRKVRRIVIMRLFIGCFRKICIYYKY